jgi:5-methylcytosine-specific restriction endonuclease McrA
MSGVLVLNYDYTPLNITSIRRGFVLVDKGKAEIVKSDENPIIAGYNTYVRPLIIRLLSYIKYNTRNIKVNRTRIYKRDNNECTYCGSKKNLTIDHIIPKSRGGQNTWMNLVTCCSSCNRLKGDKTPEEANMKLNTRPYEPTIFSEILNSSVGQVWNEFKNDIY